MGSFNEICALSGLPISYGDDVRLLFLTRNPYYECDEHESQRGCYHYDQWFLRTPPIRGKYDDYGQCDFEMSAVTRLIEAVFQTDILERPFGFNQYHACDVTKSKGIHHFLQAAWQGRLLVKDLGSQLTPQLDESFPTWQKIHFLFKEANLPLQLDSDIVSGKEAFNAQPVIRGVVCVTWNAYSNEEENLVIAQKLLEKHYDCRLVYEYKNQNPCLIVMPSGALQNSSILFDFEEVHQAISVHPKRLNKRSKTLPVHSVMVLEEVWQAYCNLDIQDEYRKEPFDVAYFLEKIHKTIQEGNSMPVEVRQAMFHLIKGTFVDIPFQTTVLTHLQNSLENDKYSDEDRQEIFQACAEAARVDCVLGLLHQAWSIPTLCGQENEWKIRTKLLENITEISRNKLKEYYEEAW